MVSMVAIRGRESVLGVWGWHTSLLELASSAYGFGHVLDRIEPKDVEKVVLNLCIGARALEHFECMRDTIILVQDALEPSRGVLVP